MIRVESLLPKAQQRLLTIGHDRQLREAAALLAEGDQHMVVVCNDAGAALGVITRQDIVRQIRHCQGCACTTLSASVMSTPILFCDSGEWLSDVWTKMKQGELQCMPILDAESRPLGLLYARDALEVLLSEVEQEEELLKDYVMCVGYR
ncbi:MAG TPA: CBS domain-containing protein [Hyphomicrobium sp.]|nr:CBS domain-containing protein [Hyphomicrobium sp.]